MITNISAVLIVKDGAMTISACLQSLAQFSEIVVYLNNTTDNTKEICAGFPNVRLIEGEFTNYAQTRNKAASYASNDWIFSIDADEQVDPGGIEALQKWQPATNNLVGSMVRHNIVMGRKMRGGRMGPSLKPRLYNRTICHFDKPVHEEIAGERTTTIELAGALLHQMTFTESKLDQWTRLEDKPHRPLPLVLIGSLFTFFRSWILQLGFIDGKPGLCYAIYLARYHMAKYHRPRNK